MTSFGLKCIPTVKKCWSESKFSKGIGSPVKGENGEAGGINPTSQQKHVDSRLSPYNACRRACTWTTKCFETIVDSFVDEYSLHVDAKTVISNRIQENAIKRILDSFFEEWSSP
jgi:hypothetical protein